MPNHLKTAHEWGVQQALKQLGYTSAEEMRKEAESLGLVAPAKTASADPLADLYAALQK